ncbi:MAG: YqgE/AlgH family protein [Hyphomicrobiaceae bacterium]|nr:YqgE/AlgH family protein [Hyphomicrobiaceae bacterium]
MKPETKAAGDRGIDIVGKLLVAMPEIGDSRFRNAAIYMCSHSGEGAMGLVINKPAPDLSFAGLLDQLGIIPASSDRQGGSAPDIPIMLGGPVETGRGFILHTKDVQLATSTISVSGDICLTGTTDMLRAMAEQRGPNHALFALGYSGWGAGQLEDELATNSWLILDTPHDVLFETPPDQRYKRALAACGIDPMHLSGSAGRA